MIIEKRLFILALTLLHNFFLVVGSENGFDYRWDFFHCYRAVAEGNADTIDPNDQIRLEAKYESDVFKERFFGSNKVYG